MAYVFEELYKGTDDFPVGLFSQTTYLSQSHYHVEYELLYIEKGKAILTINDNTHEIHGGEVYFIIPGTYHLIKNCSKDFLYYALVFDRSIFGGPTESTRKVFEKVLVNNQIFLSDELKERIKYETAELQKDLFGKEIPIKAMVYEIFSYIIKTNQYAPIPGVNEMQDEKKSIDDAINLIKSHYRENLSLNDLLESTQYSKSYFIKLFKQATGMNFTNYLNKLRIESSCRELLYTNKNVTEVATENGFNNIQYFSKIFKQYMNCTPKAYQKKWKFSKLK